MDINTLKDKVASAEAKVEKCKGTISRHEKQLEKKIDVADRLGCQVRGLSRLELKEFVRTNGESLEREQMWAVFDINTKLEDIKGAKRKLQDAERILGDWQAKLDLEVEKDKLIEQNCPQVIKDFLEQWKVNCTEYYQEKYQKWPEFTASLRNAERAARFECLEAVADVGATQFVADANLEQELWKRTSIYAPEVSDDARAAKLQKFTDEYTKHWERYCETKDDYHLRNVFPYQLMDAYLKSRGLDHQGIAARRREYGGDLLLKMVEQCGEDKAFEFLERALEAEKKAKIIDLISRIENVVGRIVDAEHLHIGPKGDLEGVIIGDTGKAKINTIGAGGYNIQCYHFRTLIHEIKEKDLESVLADAQARAKTDNANNPKTNDKYDFEVNK